MPLPLYGSGGRTLRISAAVWPTICLSMPLTMICVGCGTSNVMPARGVTITVERPTERNEDRALHGLTRTLIANMVEGVTKGFEKRLEIQGVGYRASMRGNDLELLVGYSHPVLITPRPGISFEVPQPTQITVKGIDKQMVGQTAAEIRKVRPPEPYKGKGIRYEGEYVRRKVGKRA